MRVLVLDGDVRVARALARALAQLGHETLCQATSAAARAAQETNPRVDVILSCLHLEEGQSGTSFLRWAAEHVPHAQRILMSASPCPPDFVEQPGVQSFRPKPFGRLELEALLHSRGRP